MASWGTQTIEPIAQIVLRPNETSIGKFPNEDAQSLVFDTSNLFAVDKYSGWDRVEGGSRANVGIQYTAQFNRAGAFNVMFGQSYRLFGENSFATPDITNTGLNSGLDKNVSDYVGGITYQPNPIYSFAARGRFDQSTFTPQRLEIEARANFDRWTLQLLYGDYAPQPLLGFLTRREGFLTAASVKLTANWILLGSTRYDIENDRFDQLRSGHEVLAFEIQNLPADHAFHGTGRVGNQADDLHSRANMLNQIQRHQCFSGIHRGFGIPA